MDGCQSPVYWNSLENCRVLIGPVGSNPTLSSINFLAIVKRISQRFPKPLVVVRFHVAGPQSLELSTLR